MAEKVDANAGRSFGRTLANASAHMHREQNQELRNELESLRFAVREYVAALDAVRACPLPLTGATSELVDAIGERTMAEHRLRLLTSEPPVVPTTATSEEP